MLKEMSKNEVMFLNGGYYAPSERGNFNDVVRVGDVVIGVTALAITVISGGTAGPAVFSYIVATYGTAFANKCYDWNF